MTRRERCGPDLGQGFYECLRTLVTDFRDQGHRHKRAGITMRGNASCNNLRASAVTQ